MFSERLQVPDDAIECVEDCGDIRISSKLGQHCGVAVEMLFGDPVEFAFGHIGLDADTAPVVPA